MAVVSLLMYLWSTWEPRYYSRYSKWATDWTNKEFWFSSRKVYASKTCCSGLTNFLFNRTVGCFPSGTAAEAWSWPLTPHNAEAKNEWSNTSTSTYTSVPCTGTILLYGTYKQAIHNSRLHAYGLQWEGD